MTGIKDRNLDKTFGKQSRMVRTRYGLDYSLLLVKSVVRNYNRMNRRVSYHLLLTCYRLVQTYRFIKSIMIPGTSVHTK